MKNRFKLEAILMIAIPVVVILVGVVALMFFSLPM
jgi:hypothetical protein